VAVDISTLCQRLGAFFAISESGNLALGFTVPSRVDLSLAALGQSLGAQYEAVRTSILDGQNALQQAGSRGNSALVRQPIQQLILLTISDDRPSVSTLDLAIPELIRQFEEGGESLKASVVGSSIAYDTANTGNGVLVVSTKRGNGKSCLFSYAEDLHLDCSTVDATGLATFDILGSPLINTLMPTWPGGSGSSTQTISKTSSSSDNVLGTNGTFEDNDDNSTNLPLGWIASVATLGTTLAMGSVEVQTVIIAGGPASGFYVLKWQNQAGQTQTTVPLAFNAAQGDVQNALTALVGLAGVTVSTTGSTPNFTHTITFTGVTNPSQLTSVSSLDTGTITHSTTTASSANVFRGARAVEFNSNGAELTTIQIPVTLTAQTQYVFCCFMKVDVVPVAGVMTIDLVDGVGGNVLADDEGASNSLPVSAPGLSGGFTPQTAVFRTPKDMPAQAYLRIRISSAVSNTTSVFIDEVYLGPMDEAYADGPSLAVFDGSTAWLLDDQITATITNDRGGLFHEYLDRMLSLRESRLQFPTVTNGSETQSDDLITAFDMLLESGDGLLMETSDAFSIEY
jgi:hypothetical protein